MSNEQILGEIRETNLAYLLLAQQMIRMDKASGIFRLGISQDVADILEDRLLLGLLTDHGVNKPMGQSHAAVLMAGQAAAGLA